MTPKRALVLSLSSLAVGGLVVACFNSDNPPPGMTGFDASLDAPVAPEGDGAPEPVSDATLPVSDAGLATADGAPLATDGAPATPDASDGVGGGPYLYFGDNNGGGGIFGYRVTAATGLLTPLDMDPVAIGAQPSIPTSTQVMALAVPPSHKFLYTAHTGGNVGQYAIGAGTGLLTRVDANPVDAGTQDFNVAGASFEGIAADPKGRVLYLADTNHSTLVTLSVDAATGAVALAQTTPLKTNSEPRGLAVDPAAGFLVIIGNDLPPTITRLTLDAVTGIPIAPDAGGAATTSLPGSGNCVSAALAPNGAAYTTCSQNQGIYGVAYDAGAKQLVSLGFAIAGVAPIGVAVHPSGNFAYAESFSDHTLRTFTLADGGAPALVGTPLDIMAQCRTLAFDPSGAHLFAGCDTKMITFDVDPTAGTPTATTSVAGPGASSYSLAIVP